jgi:hypothetical protein
MPGFEKRMSAEERRLLVDWMQENWYKPQVAHAPEGAAVPQNVAAPKGHD